MNMWGFTPDYFEYSEAYFKEFLSDPKNMENLKAEFFSTPPASGLALPMQPIARPPLPASSSSSMRVYILINCFK